MRLALRPVFTWPRVGHPSQSWTDGRQLRQTSPPWQDRKWWKMMELDENE